MYILGHTICSKSTYYIVDTFKSKLELIYAIYAGNDRKKGCIFTSGFSMLLLILYNQYIRKNLCVVKCKFEIF